MNDYSIEVESDVTDVEKSLRKKYRAEVEKERKSFERSLRAIQNKINFVVHWNRYQQYCEIEDEVFCQFSLDNLAKIIMKFSPSLFESYFADLKQLLDEIATSSQFDFDASTIVRCDE